MRTQARESGTGDRQPGTIVGAAGQPVWDLALRLLDGLPPGDLLEAACGGGPIASALSPQGFRVVGADLVYQCPGVEAPFVRLDLDSPLPFAPASFDIVTMVEGLGYVESPPGVLREFARALRPGGTLVVTMPNILSLRSRLRFLLNGTYRWFPHPSFAAGSKAELADVHREPLRFTTLSLYLRLAGFTVDEPVFGGSRSSAAALPVCASLRVMTALHIQARRRRGKLTPPVVNSANALLYSHVGIRAHLDHRASDFVERK